MTAPKYKRLAPEARASELVQAGLRVLAKGGNALRLVATHHDTIRRVSDMSQWYAWDAVRWRKDADEAYVRELARGLARDRHGLHPHVLDIHTGERTCGLHQQDQQQLQHQLQHQDPDQRWRSDPSQGLVPNRRAHCRPSVE